jgi:hypothetical protein
MVMLPFSLRSYRSLARQAETRRAAAEEAEYPVNRSIG